MVFGIDILKTVLFFHKEQIGFFIHVQKVNLGTLIDSFSIRGSYIDLKTICLDGSQCKKLININILVSFMMLTITMFICTHTTFSNTCIYACFL